MIWVIIFILIILASLFMAFRSMRTYQELPAKKAEFSLFLVRNEQLFNQETLNKIYHLALHDDLTFSVERLLKGDEKALVLFIPKKFAHHLIELDLLELEEYAKDSVLSHAFVFAEVKNPKAEHSLESAQNFFNHFNLEENQQFFWQIVAQPIKNELPKFQVTIRGMIIEPDSNKRIELIKLIDQKITDSTGLIRQDKPQPAALVFESFQTRSLVPKEVSSFLINSNQFLKLIGK